MTNNAGSYRFDLLSAGKYKLTVKGNGLLDRGPVDRVAGRTDGNGQLDSDSRCRVADDRSGWFNPLVDVMKTSVSAEITPTEVQNLPMVGQDVADLAYLAPGVKQTDSYDPTKNRYAILSVNGDGGRNVNVTVNGIDNKDNTVGGPVMQLPAGSRPGISHQHPALLGGEWPLRRRSHQHHHQARHEPVPRLGDRPLPRHRAEHRQKRMPDGVGGTRSRTPTTRASSLAARSAARRKKDKASCSSPSTVSASTSRCRLRPTPTTSWSRHSLLWRPG